MTDVRLAYTRATILTAVLKSEKDEKVKIYKHFIKNGHRPEWVPKSYKTKSLARGRCGQRGAEDGFEPKKDQTKQVLLHKSNERTQLILRIRVFTRK